MVEPNAISMQDKRRTAAERSTTGKTMTMRMRETRREIETRIKN
jgi:hypothetical protein